MAEVLHCHPKGIALSGGGVRSAAFAMGALQLLDYELGILRGDAAADYLSVVSGGSYIGSAIAILNGGTTLTDTYGNVLSSVGDIPADSRPLAPGSPEESHIMRHCRYLAEDGLSGAVGRFLLLSLATLSLSMFIAAWAGAVSLGILTTIVDLFIPDYVQMTESLAWWISPLAVLASLALVACFLSTVRTVRVSTRIGLAKVASGLVGMVVGNLIVGPILLDQIQRAIALDLEVHRSALLIVLAIYLAILAMMALRGSPFVVDALLLLVATMTWAAIGIAYLGGALIVRSLLIDGDASDRLLAIGLLMIPPSLSSIPEIVSPHSFYREKLSNCFAVARAADGLNVVELGNVPVSLSSTFRPDILPRVPELLVCAAINARDLDFSLAGTNVVPLIISPSRTYIPGVNGAEIPTSTLEQVRGSKSYPLMSVATAVAATGAAVSPAMGRLSIKPLRQALAILNLRLGLWLPNPAYRRTDESWPSNREMVRPRLSHFLAEFLGRHSLKAPLTYVTDGGHYENLGLVELVRQRCGEIWCIDASGGEAGNCESLVQSIMLAEAVSGAKIHLDIDRFQLKSDRRSSNPSRHLKTVYAIGRISYPDKTTGILIVVRLGLSESSAPLLHGHRRSDRLFPHHPLVNQVFRAERFIAYKRLGWDSAMQAVAGYRAAVAPVSDSS